MRIFAFFTILISLMAASSVFGQRKNAYPPAISGAREMVYKEIDDVKLKLWVFEPKEKTESPRPAMLFFFGGGWKGGNPTQFVPQSEYLAKRGMVAIVCDYRVRSRHQTLAKDCVADARDAMRFVHEHADELGIDPKRIGAGGGSAGGHIAACLGTIESDPESKPAVMALFNPACVIAPIDGQNFWGKNRGEEMKERMGVPPEELSPVHHVSENSVPCIIFHGEADSTVPHASAAYFAKKMKEAGVRCELKSYPGEPHGFFNFGRKSKATEGGAYAKTMEQLDAFLVDLGWLE